MGAVEAWVVGPGTDIEDEVSTVLASTEALAVA